MNKKSQAYIHLINLKQKEMIDTSKDFFNKMKTRRTIETFHQKKFLQKYQKMQLKQLVEPRVGRISNLGILLQSVIKKSKNPLEMLLKKKNKHFIQKELQKNG